MKILHTKFDQSVVRDMDQITSMYSDGDNQGAKDISKLHFRFLWSNGISSLYSGFLVQQNELLKPSLPP